MFLQDLGDLPRKYLHLSCGVEGSIDNPWPFLVFLGVRRCDHACLILFARVVWWCFMMLHDAWWYLMMTDIGWFWVVLYCLYLFLCQCLMLFGYIWICWDGVSWYFMVISAYDMTLYIAILWWLSGSQIINCKFEKPLHRICMRNAYVCQPEVA